MEFHEKLQHLRKLKGLTQEQLAEQLFVSRAAVSKWESGRGYPGIDSLKAIAAFYSVTIDELLSGEELLILAQDNQKQQTRMIFGLLDLCACAYLFLPLFGQQQAGTVQAVSLGLSVLGTLLFIISAQPYAAAFGFLLLGIKVFFLIKQQ